MMIINNFFSILLNFKHTLNICIYPYSKLVIKNKSVNFYLDPKEALMIYYYI